MSACCQTCGQNVPAVVHPFLGVLRAFTPNLCPRCQESRADTYAAQRVKGESKAALEAFKQTVPPRYWSTDIEHPSFNGKLHLALQKWMPTMEQPFLGLSGPTGIGKTRCAVLRGKRFAREGSRVLFLSAHDFAESVRCRFGEDGVKQQRRIEAAAKVSVLILDDLTKIRPTEAVAGALFELVEKRMAHGASMIWTSNRDIQAFVAPMSDEIREPLLGRLIEASRMLLGALP